VKIFIVLAMVCLSACGWFGRKHPAPNPSEIYVTGAPIGSTVFVDGVQLGQEATLKDHPQVLTVSAGMHKVEIHLGDNIVYREDTYVPLGEHRVVTVLSGLSRQ
jgi:hypothetical protein